MKALTICQPYASCIAIGPKRIENRSWPVRWMGPLLIHAGKSREWLDTLGRDEWPDMPPVEDLPFGAIVAICDLAGCLPISECRGQPFAEGPYCWRLDNVRPIEPIEYAGKQGLWYIPDSIVTQFKYLEVSRG